MLIPAVIAGVGLAQDRIARFGESTQYRTAREADLESGGSAPQWPLDEQFPRDVFTFARIKYTVDGTHGFGNTKGKVWTLYFD